MHVCKAAHKMFTHTLLPPTKVMFGKTHEDSRHAVMTASTKIIVLKLNLEVELWAFLSSWYLRVEQDYKYKMCKILNALNTSFINACDSMHRQNQMESSKQSKFCLGKLQSTNSWLPTTLSSESLPWWHQLQRMELWSWNTYSIATACPLASYSHGNSSPTAASHTLLWM